MSRMIATVCLFVLAAVCSTDALTKDSGVRYRGEFCGYDPKGTVALSCGTGLTCKNDYCETKSELSSASASCLDIMKKAGVIGERETVPVHGGFCYKHCDMYNLVMSARKVSTHLLLHAEPGTRAFADEYAKLSDSDKALFKAAQDKCDSCGKQCLIGARFL